MDADGDHDVDLGDFFLFQTCFPLGPNGLFDVRCLAFEVQGNCLTDLSDLASFDQLMTGPGF